MTIITLRICVACRGVIPIHDVFSVLQIHRKRATRDYYHYFLRNSRELEQGEAFQMEVQVSSKSFRIL